MTGCTELHLVGVCKPHIEQARKNDARSEYDYSQTQADTLCHGNPPVFF
jgi:hypothetical protein